MKERVEMKYKIAAFALTGVLALGAFGCAQNQSSSSQVSSSSEQKTEQTQASIKWNEVKSAEEAAKGAGFEKFGVPETLTINDREFKDPTFAYADGVAQATYESGAIALVVRKGEGKYTAPLTDRDKTEFANKWTKSYESLDVTLYGAAKGAATVMTWADGAADYGVTYQGLGGEEVSVDSDESGEIVKAIKDANASTQAAQTSSSSSTNSNSNSAAASSSSANNASSTSANDSGESSNSGTEAKYSKDDCISIATKWAGAGGQAKGEALNVSARGPIEGGGTTYYVVEFNLGEVHYEVQVDAIQGDVISGSQTFNGTQQLLDREDATPVEGTEQPAE